MLGFSPFKKHANKFNYVPRYYDPEKEARELRRAELRGERSDEASDEYQPGKYIRTQRDARIARRYAGTAAGQKRIWMMLIGAVLVLLFIYMLYPRLADVFLRARQAPAAVEETTESFDPYAPLLIVPNDYQE